jgi:dTDP-4-amino-4,6-dideoxygalactose transaminase
MIITNDDQIAERIQLLRSHGGIRGEYCHQYEAAGFNYRLSDVHGAIGVAQMQKLPEIIVRRRFLAQQLKNLLVDVGGIRLPKDPPWGGHIYQSFVIILDKKVNRDNMIAELRKLEIESTLGTYALHDQPFYQRVYGYSTGQLQCSHRAFTSTITVPLYPQMNPNDLEIVANGVRDAISNLMA